jgi:hypothetical protein
MISLRERAKPLATGVGEDGLLLRGRLEIPWGVVG